jgi:putative sigma-54 modulation protein
METRITARHFNLTPELKEFCEKQISRLERYFDRIIHCHLILDLEKSRMTAELKLKVHGTALNSKESSFDMHISVEKVLSKMEVQLKKYKAKLKDKKPRKTKAIKQELNAKALACELEEERPSF